MLYATDLSLMNVCLMIDGGYLLLPNTPNGKTWGTLFLKEMNQIKVAIVELLAKDIVKPNLLLKLWKLFQKQL